MYEQKQFVRCSSSTSEEKLANRFGLYWDRTMQDWDLVVSDKDRISDFLKVYNTELQHDDDKFTLMGLIVSSFDDAMSTAADEIEKNWNSCKIILEKECYLHYSTIKYWSQSDGENMKNIFSITPCMREIWDIVKVKIL